MSLRTIRTATHLARPPRIAGVCVCAWQLLNGVPVAASQDSAGKMPAAAAVDTTKKTATAAAADTTKKTGTAADSGKTYTPEQLDALVAPVALFPDDLLAQTLAASTYPLEIVQLQQWLAKNPNLKDKALADSVAKQPWDPSIQSMAALPDLVKRLGDDIQWTTELGNAFLADQGQVMNAVQRMRKKAKDKGTLESNEQQKVETKVVEKTEYIVIQPTNPEVVYVPSYSPTVVYGPPVYPYPPVYYPYYPPGAAFISFGVGMMWGAAMWGGACCHSHWGGGNNIYINNNNNFNRVNHNNINTGNRNNINGGNRGNNVNGGNRGGNNWSHNPSHRGGAPYADQRTADKFGGQRGAGANNRAGVSDRSAGAGQGNRAGASDRSAGGGQGNRAGTSDRSAGGGGLGGGGGAGVSDRSSSAGGGRSGGGDAIGNRSIPRDGGSGGFGGGGSYNGGNARASSSRGSSSMGSRGGGGMSRGGGGGGRRR